MSSSSTESKDRGGGNGGAVAADASSDWSCGDTECNHVNFGRRTTCHKCERERSVEHCSSSGGLVKKKLGTEIGKAAAEKSRGLFSAEDWQCSKCANVNWARRQTCNMCNAPKFCDVEERTAVGAFCKLNQDVTSWNHTEGAAVVIDAIEYERERDQCPMYFDDGENPWKLSESFNIIFDWDFSRASATRLEAVISTEIVLTILLIGTFVTLSKLLGKM